MPPVTAFPAMAAAKGAASTGAATALRGAEWRGADWASLRDLFALSREHVHLATFLLASHPKPVAEAIERHRQGFDVNPAEYFYMNASEMDEAIPTAAAAYMGGRPDQIAMTDSTTMGLAMVAGGLVLRPDDEILHSEHDHYAMGVIWGSDRGWAHCTPVVPSFSDESYGVWLGYLTPDQVPVGGHMTPGGFQAFDHRWALPEAFTLHRELGKANVQERSHALYTLPALLCPVRAEPGQQRGRDRAVPGCAGEALGREVLSREPWGRAVLHAMRRHGYAPSRCRSASCSDSTRSPATWIT